MGKVGLTHSALVVNVEKRSRRGRRGGVGPSTSGLRVALRGRAPRRGRCLHKMLCSWCGLNPLDQHLTILGAPAVGCEPLPQGQTLCMAQMHRLEAFGNFRRRSTLDST